MNFSEQIIWITGASSGIGEALAHGFAQRGAALILSGRRVDALEALAGSLDCDSHILAFETTDYGALDDIVQQAIGWRGHVDMLINNAGISQRSLACETADEVYRKIIDVDLLAPILLTQKLLPHLVQQKSGTIVNISSVAGRIGVPLRTAYCAAKHGLIGYGDALRSEVEKTLGLKVHNVLPGSVQTNVSVNALSADGSQHKRMDNQIAAGMSAEDCAAGIIAGIEAGHPEIIVAEGTELMGAQLRQSDPDKLFDLTANMGVQAASEAAELVRF